MVIEGRHEVAPGAAAVLADRVGRNCRLNVLLAVLPAPLDPAILRLDGLRLALLGDEGFQLLQAQLQRADGDALAADDEVLALFAGFQCPQHAVAREHDATVH